MVFEHSACQSVEGEHPEGLRRREQSSGLTKHTNREGGEFVLDYLYNTWLLGMILYEVTTGSQYFDRKSPREVTKLLCGEGFGVN